ncbi:Parallel_beta-helix repeat [Hexamita inflata]|uniref:Parallel_beta-helix repeat n=1 Tax=Hexamita inflata TaxID=28002 RepID=A0ABP1HDY7_9EUKA
MIIQSNIFSSSQTTHIFIYTEFSKEQTIQANLLNTDIYAIFGFNSQNISITDSIINVSLEIPVIRAALICIVCDIKIKNSTLVFQASGRQLSGIMIQSMSNIQLVATTLQFRFNSSQASGIVNMVNSTLDKFELSDCKLIGTNLQPSENNGYISSNVFLSFTMTLASVQVCVNNTNSTGANSTSFVQNGTADPRCDICQSGSVVYGLCQHELHFGTLQDGMLQCVFPFEFVNNECQCAHGYLLNVSSCVNIIDKLQSSFDDSNYSSILQQLEYNISSQFNQQDAKYIVLETNIIRNSTKIQNQISNNCNTFDQFLLNNLSEMNKEIQQQMQYIDNNTTGYNNIISQLQNQINIINSSSLQCNQFNSSTNISNSTDNYTLNTQNNISINIYTNITIDDTYIHDNMVACDQPVYTTVFDIASVTHSIGPANFASGYVFAVGSNTQDAFIDVQDGAYSTTVYPLFQSQSSFTNIKIQLGAQVVGSGSLLSTGLALTINQVNIASKDGSQVTVNATFKLSLLAQNTTSVSISGLLLNLSFSTSTQGNISLIENTAGVFNVTGFQVLGTYQSQGCVALGANTANTTAVFMNNVSFAPSAFNVGNMSSYLFNQVNSSQIQLTNVAVVLGNSSHPALSNFVFVISALQYQFGGLASQLNSTNLKVTDLSFNCKQIYKIYYIQNSGLLVGRANSSSSNITLQQICLSQVLKSFSAFTSFGVVGYLEGSIQMKQSNIFMNITSSEYISYFGTIGNVPSICPFTNLQNTQISIAINLNKGAYVAAWVGQHTSPNGTIFNSTIRNTNITASQFAGGFYAQSVAAVISYSSVFNCNITSVNHAAGFIGYISINVSIQNSTTENTVVNYNVIGAGGFVGSLYVNTVLHLVNDKTINCSLRGQQYIGGLIGIIDSNNYVQISDCLVFNTTLVSSDTMVGTLVGGLYSYYLKIVTSQIRQINISSARSDYTGLAVGYAYFQYLVMQSMSYGDNFINAVRQQNCLNFAASCTNNSTVNDIYQDITIDDTYIHDNMVACDQPVYTTVFDIASVTHSIGLANFASGYVFAVGSNTQDAFFDVQDGAYSTTVYPLFQSQSSFTNIKIQLGAQVVGSGSLLSTGLALTINQVNIASKDGSQVTVNATFKLSLLAQNTTSVSISGLLLNLSFSTSTQGNISLIENTAGVFNVTGFQVLGTYQSQGCVALGANTANTTAVFMNNVSFAPSAFNVGNMSSYFFNQVNSSQIQLTNVAVVLGNSSHPALSNFVFVISALQYQFGGLASQLNSTNLKVTDLSFNCKQIYKIYYIQNSGLLVGRANSSSSNITLQQICLSQVLKSFSAFTSFGVVGYLEGSIQMKQSNIFMNITSSEYISYFGTIGNVPSICPFTNLQNTQISIAINLNKGAYVAAWVGQHTSPNGTIFNSTIRNTNITASQFAGGFYAQSVAAVISYSSVFNCNITSVNHAAGFIGYISINVSIQNSTTENTVVNYNVIGAGGFVGSLYVNTVLHLVNDKTINCSLRGQQYIGGLIGIIDSNNYVQISDCLVFNTTLVSSDTMVGTLVGGLYSYYLKIVTSQIRQINISSARSDYTGLAVGYAYFQYLVMQSMSYGDNFINAVRQQNCLNFAASCTNNSTVNDIYQDITIDDTYIHDNMVACDQPVYTTVFDIASVTHSIGPANFASGYVFAVGSNTQDAFIDVQDGTYTAVVYPLFQSQSSFTNIKIQLGAQVVGSGSLLSTGLALTINQVNIASKDGSQVTVNATFKLSILAQNTTGVNISSLLLNLSFSTATQGNISLIENVAGVFNVTGFQVLGTYQSQGCVALGANTANTTAVFMNNVSFAPSAFNVGNMSSYLFNQVNSSQIQLTNVAVVLGNSSSPAVSNFVFVISALQYQFGGLASQLNSTNLKVTDLSFNCKQIYKIYYIQNSGLLVGRANSSSSNITLQQICLSQVIKSFSAFTSFGVVGYLEGRIQMKQSNIFMNITSSEYISNFGTVGNVPSICPFTNLQNTQISIAINLNKGTYVAAWVGLHTSPNSTILNSTISNTNITTSQFAGGFFAQSVASVISYSSVFNCNITSVNHAAGFIGYISTNVSIQNSTTENTVVNYNVIGAGGFVGSLYINTVLHLVNDKTINCSLRGQQYIGGLIGVIDSNNYVQISDCLVSNTTLVSSDTMVGTLVGGLFSYYLKIVTSQIRQINISSARSDYAGLAVGYAYFQYLVMQSMPYGDNFINSVRQQNCLNFATSCTNNGTVNDIYQDIAINDTYIHDNMVACDQPVYNTVFDIASVTHPIGPANFASGYVFAVGSNTENAFIDVQDGVYSTTVYPLFQSQSSFTNIKIQVGAQVVGAGSLLSTDLALTINQVNIASKDGSQVTVNATFKLSILAQNTTGVNISSLLLNLSFSTATQGNISLIENVAGVFNVTGFQVLGTYQSQGCVALGANTANTTAVFMNNVSFAPSAFNVGNMSSYLFNQVNSSQIQLTNVAVVLGNSSSPAVSNFVFVISALQYQFGGLASQLNSTNLKVTDLSFNCKQIYKIYYIQNSGLLVGRANSSSSNITLQQICLSQVIKSFSAFTSFGVVGYLEGRIQMKQSNIFMNITSSEYISNFGTVGNVPSICPFTNLQNTQISIAINLNKGTYVAAWVGLHTSPNSTILNSTISNTNITTSQFAGGFFAQSVASVISYSSVFNCNITSVNHAAGFIGYISTNVSIQNSTTENTVVNYNVIGAGGFVGSLYINTVLHLVNDKTINCSLRGQQYIGGLIGVIDSNNYVQISDCLVSNTTLVSSDTMVGTLVGGLFSYYLKIVTSQIRQINISSARSDYAGLAVGYAYFQYLVMQSMSYGDNFINAVRQQNCLNFAASCTNNSTVNDIYQDITIDDTYIHDNMVACDQPVYTTVFDIASVTHSIGPANFASGYVFAVGSNTQDAFIDVQDGTYTAVVYPLFQSQSSFTNIKIQLGAQVVGSGSLLSTGLALTINQVNIASKDGSQVTVNATFKLSILAQNTTGVNISSLLLNLSFSTATQGNISLIENVAGVFNVTGFQVLGTYQSQGCVALGANTANTTAVFMNNVSFAPSAFNVGNMSSYLFNQVNSSQIQLTNVAVVLGNSSSPAVSNFVFVISALQYQFGGLASQLNSTNLKVTDLSFNCKQIYKIYYIQNSGLLVGRANSSSSNITLQQICLSQVIKSFSAFTSFGVVGYLEGRIQMKQSNIFMNITSSEYISNFGTVGNVPSICPFTNLQNTQISIAINLNKGTYVAAWVGLHTSPNSTILNSTISNTNITTSQFAGGFFAQSVASVISYSSVFNCNITSVNHAAGFIGYISTNVSIQNSTTENTVVNYNVIGAGGFVGSLYINTVLHLVNDKTINCSLRGQQYIGGLIGVIDSNNYVQISDCLVSNTTLVSSDTMVGTLVGGLFSYYLKIVTSQIRQINISSARSDYAGLAVGYAYFQYLVMQSMSYGDNFINAVRQQNCLNFAASCTNNSTVNDIYQDITIDDTYIHDNMVACDQPVYTTVFDIASVTHSIGLANFASGYVFAVGSNTQDAFIDVQDGTYTAVVYPLFQSQSSFTNIKIQLGAQVVGSGSLLSTGLALTINQVNIASKDGSQVTVNATFKLSLLAQNTTSVSISGLLLNLSFSTSTQGNISLIENTAGVFNVTGFQVLGTYQSQGCVALGANTANTTAVFMNNVSFAPSAFNVGNMSSYFFNQVNSSQIQLTNVAVVLGNSSHPALSNFVFVISALQYQFGGLASQLNSTNLKVTDLSFNCKQIYKIYYIQNSGLLVGRANSSSSNITLQQICLSQVLKSFSAFTSFGVVGYLEGSIQMKQSNIFMNITSSEYISYFGTIGNVPSICPFTNLQNTQISIAINLNKGAYVAAWVGQHTSPNGTIFNSTIRNTNITASQFAGGFYAQSVAAVISYSSVFNCNITSVNHAAGYIAQASGFISILNCTIENSFVKCNASACGAYIGYLYQSSTLNLLANSSNSSLSGTSYIGGIIGLTSTCIVNISSYIFNSLITATNQYAGALIGFSSATNLILFNSRIEDIIVQCTTQSELIIGYAQYIFTVSNSTMVGNNYLNGLLKNNCANFANNC